MGGSRAVGASRAIALSFAKTRTGRNTTTPATREPMAPEQRSRPNLPRPNGEKHRLMRRPVIGSTAPFLADWVFLAKIRASFGGAVYPATQLNEQPTLRFQRRKANVPLLYVI